MKIFLHNYPLELPSDVIDVCNPCGRRDFVEFKIQNVGGWRRAAVAARAVLRAIRVDYGDFSFVGTHRICGTASDYEEDLGGYYVLEIELGDHVRVTVPSQNG